MVEAGGIEPKSAAARGVPCCGHAEATCGHEASNSGQLSRVTTSTNRKLGTEAGHGPATYGQSLALKWPQRLDADLARVIEAWPKLSVELRAAIVKLVDTTQR